MKKTISFLSLFLLVFFANAQWTDDGNSITTTDNVGIGTASPGAKFHVYGSNVGSGNVLSSIMLGKHNGPEIQGVQESSDDDAQGLAFRVKSSYANADSNYEALRITRNGNVGIGTTSPDAKLHIYGSNVGTGNVLSSIMLGKHNGPEIQGVQESSDDDAQGLAFRVKSSYANADSNYEALRITRNGNVGIGTTSPDAKLAVNGDIHTKEVKVDLIGWPDFVFEKEYNLPSLQEVEIHIAENGHLRDIPSAKEVEENGIKLGEMNSKLLQKIEELMLYTIQQQKEIEALKEQNIQLVRDVQVLK